MRDSISLDSDLYIFHRNHLGKKNLIGVRAVHVVLDLAHITNEK